MKKEKNFSETDFSEKIEPSDKKALESLSDDEILQGFKDADARIVREYYYGYCRVAYCIYDKRYDLQHKPGMDFFFELYLRGNHVEGGRKSYAGVIGLILAWENKQETVEKNAQKKK